MRILLAGASGVIGSALREGARGRGHDCVLVGRRSLGTGDEEVITTFREALELPEADVAVCALGTTIAQAGSQEAFYAVDHDAVMTFAEAAQAAGVEHFLVVTAVGANPRARVFYSRVKGEVERDLEALSFRRLDIAQPGLLLGPREEHRPVELFLKAIDPIARRFMPGSLDRYAGIEADTVARALLNLSEQGKDAGTHRHQNRDLQRIAG
jgi:uncharacterized protein YbjT (DUF2867 family)